LADKYSAATTAAPFSGRRHTTLPIPGMVVAILAYPVYQLITNNRKKKYADEIMRLSDDLMGQ
jgi:hypothetical protein